MTFPFDTASMEHRLRPLYRRLRRHHPIAPPLDRGYVAHLDKRLNKMINRDLHETGLVTGTPNEY